MFSRGRTPRPAQTSMSHYGAAYGVGPESIVNRMTQPRMAYPKRFQSKCEPPLPPVSSSSAAS
eukprot:5431215-Prorocentrum_lima.AAC.1